MEPGEQVPAQLLRCTKCQPVHPVHHKLRQTAKNNDRSEKSVSADSLESQTLESLSSRRLSGYQRYWIAQTGRPQPNMSRTFIGRSRPLDEVCRQIPKSALAVMEKKGKSDAEFGELYLGQCCCCCWNRGAGLTYDQRVIVRVQPRCAHVHKLPVPVFNLSQVVLLQRAFPRYDDQQWWVVLRPVGGGHTVVTFFRSQNIYTK